ncbi:MAG TPA: phosphodiester glycosidase family protein [Gaiellaceae bacterium]
MTRRLALVALLYGVLTPAALAASPVTLLPGVTFEQGVQFTLHGPVAVDVITAPRPGDQQGLYALAAVTAHGPLTAGRDRLTRIERDLSAQATVVGIDGDFPAKAGLPAGILMQGGALEHTPEPARSSIGIDQAGTLHVDRVSFAGSWQGTGQRRPVAAVNQPPARNQVVLLTPAYGSTAPAVAGSAEVVLQPLAAAVPGADLQAPAVAVGAGGGEAIPPDGAVLQATGTAVASLQAEAPAGTPVTVRLALEPTWAGTVSALGGGPVLVRAGKAVFRSGESFTSDQISDRGPRAAVGQLADGRVILVAVDGDQPGYSVGMTSFELAQTMARLGAVTACAVASGGEVTAAFDGRLLDRPSVSGGGAMGDALLEEYFGVYAPPPPEPLLNGDPGADTEPLQYKLVRPSTVTAELVGPDGTVHPIESSVAHDPGTYTAAADASTLQPEGEWHWNVTARDDLGRVSTIDRAFLVDSTLRGLAVAPAPGRANVRFVLGHAATVRLRIETAGGVTVRALPAVALPVGPQSLAWDGRLPGGARAPGGAYVAHVFATSDVGTSDLQASFTLRAAP